MSTIENALALQAAVAAFPPERFDLYTFQQQEHACGTACCAMGVMPFVPHFKEQYQFKITQPSRNDAATFEYLDPDTHGTTVRTNNPEEVADQLFGPYSFDALFDRYGEGVLDSKLIAEHNLMSQSHMEELRKQLAMLVENRLTSRLSEEDRRTFTEVAFQAGVAEKTLVNLRFDKYIADLRLGRTPFDTMEHEE